MTRISISLSDELNALADAPAAESGCASIEEYVEQLIRRDASDDECDGELKQLLLERLDCPWAGMDAVDFARMREKFRRCLDGEPELA